MKALTTSLYMLVLQNGQESETRLFHQVHFSVLLGLVALPRGNLQCWRKTLILAQALRLGLPET